MRSDFFIVCTNCNSKKLLFEVFNKTGERLITQIENAKNKTHKMRCSKCKVLGKVAISSLEISEPKTKPEPKPKPKPIAVRYEAFRRNKNMVFHRSTCKWLDNARTGQTIKFKEREIAISKGFSPCRNCRP